MTAITYRGYTIDRTDPVPPIPTWRQFAWQFCHPDNEPGDPRFGHAPTPEACKAEIDAIEAEIAERMESV